MSEYKNSAIIYKFQYFNIYYIFNLIFNKTIYIIKKISLLDQSQDLPDTVYSLGNCVSLHMNNNPYVH